MIIFFTFLTFYSAFYNKVTDCGCFGDAIKLTPWQSFGKDVILFVLLVWLLFQKVENIPSARWQFGVSLGSAIFSLFIAYWAVEHLPFIDFRAYKIGSDIQANMKPSAPLKYGKDRYFYTNKKTKQDESSEEFEKRWLDTNMYKYKKIEPKKLLNPEAQAKITDYKVMSSDMQEDLTKKTFEGKKLLIVVAEANKTNPIALKKMNDLARSLEKKGIEPMILTATGAEEFDKLRHQYQISVPFYAADKTVLKTMIRSNPGLMYWENGVVKNMWHYNDIPTEKAF
jgi:hypothetical protein